MHQLPCNSQWKLITEVDGVKVYLDEASIEAVGTIRRVVLKYVTTQYGTDLRNGKAVKETVMHEEYDLHSSNFRIHRITFVYDNGEVGDPLSIDPKWQPATGGSQTNLEYLRLHSSH